MWIVTLANGSKRYFASEGDAYDFIWAICDEDDIQSLEYED